MDKLISPKELSELLRVSKPWPYVAIERKLLPFYKIGVKGKRGIVRFKMSDVERYIEQCRVEKK